ncbi:UNVERIFIED_CONTAM: hypothetical protein GTU68_032774 [Idotea baltica]|nr:hypothetical protein [Idotea baltica]
MRNHLGSKPYKCNKCSYSCVNKSMLNSHMKSHSNIYQYRCADCSYATKYCHSLKLHLRKYSHTPAMVLNPDGTPNPVPIIDIYGTRRGPKLKKDENGMPILPPQYQLQAQFMRAHMEVTGNIPPAPTAPQEKLSANKPGAPGMHLPLPQSPFQSHFSFPANIQNYPSFIPHEFKETHKQKKDLEEAANESTEKEETLNMSKSPEVQESFKCELCNFATQSKDILSHHLLLHARDNEEAEMRRASLASHLNEANDGVSLYGARRESTSCSPSFQREQSKPVQHPFPSQLPGAPNSIQEYLARTMNPIMFNPLIGNPGSFPSVMEFQQRLNHIMYQSSKEQVILAAKEKSLSLSPIKLNSTPQTEVVLDLSKEQTPPNAVSSSQPHSSSSSSPSFLPASPPNSDISTPPSKSRRKGRAFKLERIALRLSGSGEEGESSCNEGGETQKEHGKAAKGNQVPPLLPLDLPEAKENESSSLKGKWGDAYQCQYCDIAFKDLVMYTMHMGYHGFKNPFICNMCGFDAEEKVAFFLHIGRFSHL